MTQAYNLSQLANNLNSSGQLDATDGLVNAVPVANGGTGATTGSAARTNLGAAASGANTDITSLSAPALGAATATTQATNDNTTKVATTAFVAGQAGTASPLASGTAAVGTSLLYARQDHVHQQSISSATAVATTSGTSVDFTGIPSWAKRITIAFNGVSTNGTSALILQIGAGSFVTSGYISSGVQAGGTNTATGLYATAGFLTGGGLSAATIMSGVATLIHMGGNLWVFQSSGGFEGASFGTVCGGNLSLGGTLDRVRLTSILGVDTFDAGSMNLLWE